MDCRDQLPSLAGQQRHPLKKRWSMLRPACWLGLASLSLLASGGCRATLDGYLVDEQGSAIASHEARVNLISLKGERKDRATVLAVDSDGYFVAEEPLGEGLYFVEALVPGYKIQSLRFHLAAPQRLQLKLEALPKTGDTSLKAAAHINDERGAGEVTLNPPEL